MLGLIEINYLEVTVGKDGLIVLIKKTIEALKYSVTIDPDYAHNYEAQICDYEKCLKQLED